jgi:hypothetical protein
VEPSEFRERPVLFSSPMVKALLDDRKKQTRRIMKSQPYTLRTEGFGYPTKAGGFVSLTSEHCLAECPYGKPGDRLYVKEAAWVWCRKVPNGKTKTGRQKYAYRPFAPHLSENVRYFADHPECPDRSGNFEPDMVWRYKHARYMPKRLARIVIEITDVSAQRIHDISDQDAIAEGIEPVSPVGFMRACGWKDYSGKTVGFLRPRDSFKSLWESINGQGSWDANPWVWAIGLRRI